MCLMLSGLGDSLALIRHAARARRGRVWEDVISRGNGTYPSAGNLLKHRTDKYRSFGTSGSS